MKRKIVSILLILLLAITILSGCDSQKDSKMADTVVLGTIYTADDKDSVVQAVAMKDGVYQYVGDEKGVKAYTGENTKVIKLEDGMAMPSFFESHGHASSGGMGKLFEVDMSSGKSVDDYVKIINAFLQENPEMKFLKGAGWVNGYCPKGGPTKDVLDKISTKIPIVILSSDHHSIWANSKAIELAGVTASTPDVPGGVIERDPVTKAPTGTFRENANGLIAKVIPDYSVEQYKEGILAYQNEVKEYGITSVFDPMLNIGESENLFKAYNELDKSNQLKMKVYAGWQISQDKDPLNELDKVAKLKEESKGGNFELTSIKLFTDGVIEGKTAYLLDDYANTPGFKGVALWKQDLLNQVCAKADKLGLQIHTHAIGDAAVKMAIDAYEYVAKVNGTTDNRHAITHLQVVDPADFKRMADLKIVAVTNAYWYCKEPGYFNEVEVPYLGEAKANKEYPQKSFFDAGVVVSTASDYPVTLPPRPLEAIQKGITRTNLEGDQNTLLGPEEKVNITQMMRSTTMNGAYQNFAEDKIGSIEVGKDADMIILDKNIMKIDPYEISKTNVLKTIFDGKVIYEKK